MASSLFQDLALSEGQLNTDYRLSKLNEAGNQVDSIQGNNENNNILIGDNITGVPDVANMVIIGDGNKANVKAKDILLGDGVTVAGGDVAGSLHIGQGMEAVGGGVTAVGAGSSNVSIRIYYNGQNYYLPLFDARA